MKRLPFILVMLLFLSSCTSGYDYEIKSFQCGDKDFIYQADANVLIIGDEEHFKMYDFEGNELTKKWYFRIYPLNYEQTIYEGAGTDIYVTTAENKTDTEKAIPRSNVYTDKEAYREQLQYCIKRGLPEFVSDKYVKSEVWDAFDLSGKLLYSQKYSKKYTYEEQKKIINHNKLFLYETEEKKYYVADENFNPVTSRLYDNYQRGLVVPGFLELETSGSVLVCNTNTGEWIEVDSIEAYTLKFEEGTGIIEKTKDGKYVYYDNHLKKVTDIEFDRFLGEYNTSAVFEKNGK